MRRREEVRGDERKGGVEQWNDEEKRMRGRGRGGQEGGKREMERNVEKLLTSTLSSINIIISYPSPLSPPPCSLFSLPLINFVRRHAINQIIDLFYFVLFYIILFYFIWNVQTYKQRSCRVYSHLKTSLARMHVTSRPFRILWLLKILKIQHHYRLHVQCTYSEYDNLLLRYD